MAFSKLYKSILKFFSISVIIYKSQETFRIQQAIYFNIMCKNNNNKKTPQTLQIDYETPWKENINQLVRHVMNAIEQQKKVKILMIYVKMLVLDNGKPKNMNI